MARILVIDDNHLVRDTVKMVLAAAGHEVLTAPEGSEGVRSFTLAQPDLVITDIVMPEKDGIEVVTELRRMNARVPIIAISGHDSIGMREFLLRSAQAFGAQRTFAKPFDPDELLDAVLELLPRAA